MCANRPRIIARPSLQLWMTRDVVPDSNRVRHDFKSCSEPDGLGDLARHYFRFRACKRLSRWAQPTHLRGTMRRSAGGDSCFIAKEQS